MKKIILTAAGVVLIAMSVANASAAPRQQTRHPATQQSSGVQTDLRDSFNQWGYNRGPSTRVYDGRYEGGAISAPAGR